MTNVAFEGNHFHWSFTAFTIICMVSTFALGWCLLQEFVSELLQSKDKEKLYGYIMHTGIIVLLFEISKFYLLLCFRKKLEIVDLVVSETDENSTEVNNEVEEAHKDDRDDHKGYTKDQDVMEGENSKSQGLVKEQGDEENRVDLNMDSDQNQPQNFSETQEGQNLEDAGTNRQDDEWVQGQNIQDYEGSVEHVLVLDDTKVHTHDSGNQNIQPLPSTRSRIKRECCRSQSMSEGQNYESSRHQDDQNIEPYKLRRGSIRRGDPEKFKPRLKNQSISNIEKTRSLYDLRHRSCLSWGQDMSCLS